MNAIMNKQLTDEDKATARQLLEEILDGPEDGKIYRRVWADENHRYHCTIYNVEVSIFDDSPLYHP